jgi:hypothetical protein
LSANALIKEKYSLVKSSFCQLSTDFMKLLRALKSSNIGAIE